MAEKSKVHFKSNIPSVFNINIKLGGNTYHVQTEFAGVKNPSITTHIYYNGEIVYLKKTDCSDILRTEDYDGNLRHIMEKQQKNVLDEFMRRHEENRKKIEYFDTVKKLLMRKNNKQALKILEDGLNEFPEDPFILSYYGYLRAIVEKKYEEGINICKRVLEKIDPDMSLEEKSLYAEFYLNLGRAYLAAGDKRSAVDAFNDGLKLDKDNHDLLWELKKLGTRRKPIVSFLLRCNPINKYIGFLLSRLKGE